MHSHSHSQLQQRAQLHRLLALTPSLPASRLPASPFLSLVLTCLGAFLLVRASFRIRLKPGRACVRVRVRVVPIRWIFWWRNSGAGSKCCCCCETGGTLLAPAECGLLGFCSAA